MALFDHSKEWRDIAQLSLIKKVPEQLIDDYLLHLGMDSLQIYDGTLSRRDELLVWRKIRREQIEALDIIKYGEKVQS